MNGPVRTERFSVAPLWLRTAVASRHQPGNRSIKNYKAYNNIDILYNQLYYSSLYFVVTIRRFALRETRQGAHLDEMIANY